MCIYTVKIAKIKIIYEILKEEFPKRVKIGGFQHDGYLKSYQRLKHDMLHIGRICFFFHLIKYLLVKKNLYFKNVNSFFFYFYIFLKIIFTWSQKSSNRKKDAYT